MTPKQPALAGCLQNETAESQKTRSLSYVGKLLRYSDNPRPVLRVIL